VKVRIGVGLGTHSTSGSVERFGDLVDGLEAHRFDSLWLSERLTSDCPDPLVAMSFAVARTTRLKVGTSVMVLPGRNPVVLAKALASLDQLSGGRVLPAFGLGAPNAAEHQAFGVQRSERAAWFDEALPLLRRLWAEDHVDHDGSRFQLRDVSIRPKPLQQPLDVWGGGTAPSELRRVARYCNGWLPSFCSPAQAEAGRATIEELAAQEERSIDPEHFGVLLPYLPDGTDGVPEPLAALYRSRNPDADPADLVATRSALPPLIQRFVDVGFSKFVVVPIVEPDDWDPELAELAAIVQPLQT
jgi:probable F420-dependent oxidoreductase